MVTSLWQYYLTFEKCAPSSIYYRKVRLFCAQRKNPSRFASWNQRVSVGAAQRPRVLPISHNKICAETPKYDKSGFLKKKYYGVTERVVELNQLNNFLSLLAYMFSFDEQRYRHTKICADAVKCGKPGFLKKTYVATKL
jgi:hypothetical protein